MNWLKMTKVQVKLALMLLYSHRICSVLELWILYCDFENIFALSTDINAFKNANQL